MSLTFTQNVTLHIHNMPIQPYRHVLKALENKQTRTHSTRVRVHAHSFLHLTPGVDVHQFCPHPLGLLHITV